MEVNHDLEVIVAARPALDDQEALKRWAEAIEVKQDSAITTTGAAVVLRIG